ncbi:MAG: hypothetical protein ABI643_02870 [Candidatus Doudnabacteria bacterium]
MSRLETQINQIYLSSPDNKKSSLILYEEAISNSAHLFVLAEIRSVLRKSDAADLKKISEIILESFRSNKKLAAETLFETSLAQVNQNLADLAHAGHKSWVGKFSCLIALKSGENIYVANNGQTSAWLLRKSELMEILKPEKQGMHPLKTFTNFTQGRLVAGDGVIITTSNIFNFVSVELFERILTNKALPQATDEISKLLLDLGKEDLGFSTFFLEFKKKQEMEPQSHANPVPVYAPLPEEMEEPQTKSTWHMPIVPGLPKFQMPKFSMPEMIPRISWNFFQNLSASGKFFFISFSIFLLLFLGNLGVYGIKLHGKNTNDKIEAQAQLLAKDLSDAQSSLIYKNTTDGLRYLNLAVADFDSLQKLSASKASEYQKQLQTLKDQINKVSVVSEPKVLTELKHQPIFFNRSSIGFLLTNQDSNTLTLYDSNLNDYFLLNSLKDSVTGIGFYQPAGVVVSSGSSIYHIDQTLKQLEPIVTVANGKLQGTEAYSSNLYSLNLAADQVVKIGFSKNKYSTTLINAGSLQNIRDFGLDKDIYLLYPDKLVKITGGKQIAFGYPNLSEPITNATKIFVGSNLYILESNKKRVVVLNKNGQLLNQIYLPNTTLFDLVVDEAAHSLYLLGDNKLYQITL